MFRNIRRHALNFREIPGLHRLTWIEDTLSPRYRLKSFALEVITYRRRFLSSLPQSRRFLISIILTAVVRLSLWCPSWEVFWVVVTFATSAVKTPQQLYACRFLVSHIIAESNLDYTHDKPTGGSGGRNVLSCSPHSPRRMVSCLAIISRCLIT